MPWMDDGDIGRLETRVRVERANMRVFSTCHTLAVAFLFFQERSESRSHFFCTAQPCLLYLRVETIVILFYFFRVFLCDVHQLLEALLLGSDTFCRQ